MFYRFRLLNSNVAESMFPWRRSNEDVVLVRRTCIVVTSGLFYLSCPAGQAIGAVSIMSCQMFAQELADLPSINSNFKSLTKEELTLTR